MPISLTPKNIFYMLNIVGGENTMEKTMERIEELRAELDAMVANGLRNDYDTILKKSQELDDELNKLQEQKTIFR